MFVYNNAIGVKTGCGVNFEPADQNALQDVILDYFTDPVHRDSKDYSDIESDCSDIDPSISDGLTNREARYTSYNQMKSSLQLYVHPFFIPY